MLIVIRLVKYNTEFILKVTIKFIFLCVINKCLCLIKIATKLWIIQAVDARPFLFSAFNAL